MTITLNYAQAAMGLGPYRSLNGHTREASRKRQHGSDTLTDLQVSALRALHENFREGDTDKVKADKVDNIQVHQEVEARPSSLRDMAAKIIETENNEAQSFYESQFGEFESQD